MWRYSSALHGVTYSQWRQIAGLQQVSIPKLILLTVKVLFLLDPRRPQSTWLEATHEQRLGTILHEWHEIVSGILEVSNASHTDRVSKTVSFCQIYRMYSNIDPNSYGSVSHPRLASHWRQIQMSAHLPVLAYLIKELIEGGLLPWIVDSNLILPLGCLCLALTEEQEEEE